MGNESSIMGSLVSLSPFWLPALTNLMLSLASIWACMHCTRALLATIMAPLVILNGFMSLQMGTWSFVLYLVSVLIGVILCWVAWRKLDYDFSTKVLSIRGLINLATDRPKVVHAGDRIIGRVLPYNVRQLKYSNRFIVSSSLAAAGGMLISGSTGSGKTYGILSMIRQNILKGNSVIFAEYKGDPEVIEDLKSYGESKGYDVYVICQGESNFNYDPLRHLNNTGRIEAVMNMRKWSMDGSDAHYKTATQLLLQKTIQEFSHKWVFETEKALQEGVDISNRSYTMEYYRWMQCYQAGRTELDAYTTVTKLLELLVTSSLHPMFHFKNGKTLDLQAVKNGRFMLLVSFVSSNKELATSFSSLLFKDLLDEWTRQAPNSNTFLYVDEAGTLENAFIVKDILEKGRSAKIAPVLSMQDINQIIITTNEAYLNSILGTINTFIIYSGATRVTAEKFAGVQIADIETVLMNLRKPINGKKPTAIYISKYPSINKRTNAEVYRFEPYIYDEHWKRFVAKRSVKSVAEGSAHGDEEAERRAAEERKRHDEELDALLAGELTQEERLRQQGEELGVQVETVEDELDVSQPVEPEQAPAKVGGLRLKLGVSHAHDQHQATMVDQNVDLEDQDLGDIESLIFGNKR